MKKLIIVESPTKANTIKKFLNKEYTVLSSYGHIRDLPKSELGVDPEKDFKIKYVIPTKAKKNVTLLKKEVEKAELVFLATDPDREGEAISWHLIEALKLEGRPYKRITFHEITKEAIESSLKHPSAIDINLVNAQQARRVLDRIVGYKLSPFLWKKVAKKLSAGRVQSIAIRLIVDREREIQAFKSEEYWSIDAELEKKEKFIANLTKIKGKSLDKLEIKTKEVAEEIKLELEKAKYKVSKIEKKNLIRHPLPPFTTSTLQQEASKKLGYPSKFTMSVAQSLYEKGLITYHRTDSLTLSEQALNNAKSFIETTYGSTYYPESTKRYKAKGRAQEAHEAIRPTNVSITPETFTGDEKQKKLYKLIWTRFVACQMRDAIFASTKAIIDTDNEYTLQASGLNLQFDGFLKVYPMKSTERDIPDLNEGDEPDLIKINTDQHFTQPPARYNEASLIKEMEENEIGRPATYASIISTIQERNYTNKNEDKRFVPTDIGFTVVDILKEHFPNIVDIKFTAKMEKDLDYVARGKQDWIDNLKNFYGPFIENLTKKYEEVKKTVVEEEISEKKCPKCGKNLVAKMGRFGKFLACPGYPECKHIESLEKKEPKRTGVTCPKCNQAEIVEKRTKKGKIFYACPNWPDCDFALWDKPTKEVCEKCGSIIVEKGKKTKCSNPKCK
ncbi:MAG: type I DNA topoisomerase [Candidatus Pacebacteria bacterium]|nr:type I DNA topoisomerase [Candidatus Paceibacterota bacterium]